MLKIENFEVVGWEHAIRGMRNPKNSWEKSDSEYHLYCDDIRCEDCPADGIDADRCMKYLNNVFGNNKIGPNDYDLMNRLANGGPVHAKYRRMITVYLDITAPLYWWKEFDTYKVGTVANSCSTMHKIHSKEFTLEDFSIENLFSSVEHSDEREVPTIDISPYCDGSQRLSPIGIFANIIRMLNECRSKFLETKDNEELKKKYWWQMIQLLPSSYNQKRTVMLNYEVLTNIYRWRRDHKLDEWHTFCDWIEKLPYSELITGKKVEE